MAGGADSPLLREGIVVGVDDALGSVCVRADGCDEGESEIEEEETWYDEAQCRLLGSPFAVRDTPLQPLTPCDSFDFGYPAPTFVVREPSMLPPGLCVDRATGELSGCAREEGRFRFEVVAENVAGRCSAEVEVNVCAPGLPGGFSYQESRADGRYTGLQYLAGEEVLLTPTNLDAAAVRYRVVFTVQPALPAGLELDSSTGAIAGRVRACATARRYQVRALSVCGSSRADLRLKVGDAGSLPAAAATESSLGEGVALQVVMEGPGSHDELGGVVVRVAGGWKVRLDAGPQLLVGADSGGLQLDLFPLADDFHLPSGAVIKARFTYDYLVSLMSTSLFPFDTRDPNKFQTRLSTPPWRLAYPEAVATEEGRVSNVLHLHESVRIEPRSLQHMRRVCGRFVVSPELPCGLGIDEDGVIGGAPLELSALTEYMVLVSCGAETLTASVAFAVERRGGQPRVLAFYAQHKADDLNVWGEAQQLESLMSGLGSLEVSMNVQPLFDDFCDAVALCAPRNCRIVHLAGHGERERGFLFVANRSGTASAAASSAAIARVLGAQSCGRGGPVECVVLNACYSEDLGRLLRSEGVGSVVCWRWKVDDAAAAAFSHAFYAHLDHQLKSEAAAGAGASAPDRRYRAAFLAGVDQLAGGGTGAGAARGRLSCSFEPLNRALLLSEGDDLEPC